jgi:hypothetical protein
MAPLRSTPSSISFAALSVEGNLIAPAMLKDIASITSTEQTAQDYAVPRGVTLRDELARYFRIGQATYAHLHRSSAPSLGATTRFVSDFLTSVLGFNGISAGSLLTQSSGMAPEAQRQFPISLQALNGRVPIVVVPPSDSLESPSTHLRPDGRRRSAAIAVQDWLNASEAALWGLCCNGFALRLLRDNHSLTRPAFIEFDLAQIFANEDFASFTLLWLLLHSSRFGPSDMPPSDCPLERWRDAGAKTGEVALKALADNVHDALLALGNGFLSHPNNDALRRRLAPSGGLALSSTTGEGHSFFSQLLRLVYRLIFLLAAEDRDLLHPPDTKLELRNLYATAYSLGNLRDRAIRRAAWDAFDDRWQGLCLTFRGLAHGEPLLGLPALGGLFAASQTPDLDDLALSNRDLFAALYHLAWLRSNTAPVPVNWRDMQTEELGSVYEGLLELTPRLDGSGRGMTFAEGVETKGNERKTSGSYYTPDSLVQTLLDSALDPVLDRLEAEPGTNTSDPAAHLLTVTVIDPACGSGHFLLAAARRIATRVARLRKDGVPSQDDYRIALRDVVRLCIYGVDRNPMAVELSRVALWIETVEPGKPLGFLDANLRCGDALLGIFSLDALSSGIPEAAYKPLAGDDRLIAKVFSARNKEDLKGQGRLGLFGQTASFPAPPALARAASALRTLPEESEQDIEQRMQFFDRLQHSPELTQWSDAADLYIAAFIAPKKKPLLGTDPNSEFPGMPLVPVSSHVWKRLEGGQVQGNLLGAAREFSGKARAFHWPLEFPHILLTPEIERRGFDILLGNPPWERIKLQEQEFFASREPTIAEAPNAAARGRMIAELKESPVGSMEQLLHQDFEIAKRTAEASSIFARIPANDNGRFPFTGRGDVNTYALFAELFCSLNNPAGRAGVIVPTGIATDATTAPFFAELVKNHRLARLIDFENSKAIFPNVHRSYKFSLLTTAHAVNEALFTFYLTDTAQLSEPHRTFILTAAQIAAINPNTLSAPLFRTDQDAALTAGIHHRIPVLLLEDDSSPNANPWNITFHSRLWHMAEDSSWFKTLDQIAIQEFEQSDWVGLFESKMVHQFDHRWSSAENSDDDLSSQLRLPSFEVRPRYWVPRSEVIARLSSANWENEWLIGWRNICRSTDERTLIVGLIPRGAVSHSMPLMFPDANPYYCAALVSNLNSICTDFVARQKLGGVNFTMNYLRQLPVIPPSAYTPAALDFIVRRALELTYTSYSMRPFARDLGYSGEPYAWDEDRRALLRAELDAWYARAYGLSRDDLRYVLDPAEVFGPDYPSETFRVLRNSEIKKFGEYRTQRLVLAAWDRQAANETPLSEVVEISAIIPATVEFPARGYSELPDNAWAISRPEPYKPMVDATRLLAAILKQVTSSSRDEIGVIYAYASRPEKLTRFLPGADSEIWLRLVGPEARPLPAGVVAMPDRPDLPFDQARSWLVSRNALVQDLTAGTWSNGSVDTGLSLDGWPEGRARFVLEATRSLGLATLLEPLTTDERVWEVRIA